MVVCSNNQIKPEHPKAVMLSLSTYSYDKLFKFCFEQRIRKILVLVKFENEQTESLGTSDLIKCSSSVKLL